VTLISVESARQMLEAVEAALPAEIGIFTAAVADWRAADEHAQKIKKAGKGKPQTLTLTENPDILRAVARRASLRPPLVIGFAAETENIVDYAKKKLAAKGCDWIVANDVSVERGVMGGDDNQVLLVTKDGVEGWPQMRKDEVAEKIMQRAAAFLRDKRSGLAAAAAE
jgi:phosphopantothenoylcysteine decarboxylase/phosphopantothenate--cysteine ligase